MVSQSAIDVRLAQNRSIERKPTGRQKTAGCRQAVGRLGKVKPTYAEHLYATQDPTQLTYTHMPKTCTVRPNTRTYKLAELEWLLSSMTAISSG
eukprot:765300-Heterocapsa_arctica.AAC.1